jgi:GcrA cell cycle regulator
VTWTPEAIAELRQLWTDGTSTAEIGRRLGQSKAAICGKAHRLGLPGRGSPLGKGAAPRPVDEDAVLALLRAGRSVRSVAERTGVHRERVQKIADAHGIPVRSPGRAPVAKPRQRKPSRPRVKRIAQPKPIVFKAAPRLSIPTDPRGKPGVWVPPIGRTIEQIEQIAADMGFAFGGLHDLPALSKHRVALGYAPLAVNFPRSLDFVLPGTLRSKVL